MNTSEVIKCKLTSSGEVRKQLIEDVVAKQEMLLDLLGDLVRARSENPPGDTEAAANVARQFLELIPSVEIDMIVSEPPITNLVARLKGRGPGRRLVFNGHLDTYPSGPREDWSFDPFNLTLSNRRLYGRGVSDMKGGIACSLLAMAVLAKYREYWDGEVAVVLAGDEETMGERGTAFLMDRVPHASGDIVLCGDAGSPQVMRFGEKGMVWLTIEARGKGGHGAHVHLGENAIERLMHAVSLVLELRQLKVRTPAEINTAIDAARSVSERISGAGESDVLRSVTVNCGAFNGGESANLIPDYAQANLDIRLPVGISVADIEREIALRLDGLEGIEYQILRRYEPTWTSPSHEIISILQRVGQEVLGDIPVANMRVGASDTRLYRRHNQAAVVCGLTPNNMGRPDEYINVDELAVVSHMHTMAAFEYLSAGSKDDD